MLKFFINNIIFIAFLGTLFGCNTKKKSDDSVLTSPASKHNGMCQQINLGEASDAVEKQLPNNQYVSLQGMSSPRTLVWQDTKTQKVYFAAKIMGAKGKLFYMEELPTGKMPSIKSSFSGTLLLWKHLPGNLLTSMKAQFKAQWGTNIDIERTHILVANQKPDGCE